MIFFVNRGLSTFPGKLLPIAALPARQICLSAVVVFAATLLPALCGIANPSGPYADLTGQQWHEDLAFFARELPKRHTNAFYHTSREKFEAAVSTLDARIDSLDADEIYVGIDRLANLIGDAHTYVEFPKENANLPIDIRQFDDEYRVVAVGQGNEKALGARVLAIDNTPIKSARELAEALTPQAETPELARVRIEGFLTTGMALRGLGITLKREVANYRLQPDEGGDFTVEVRAPPAGSKPEWLQVEKEIPLYRQNPGQKAWCKYLSGARTVYCNIRQVRELSNIGKEMMAMVEREKPDKLAIDLRQNSGGDFNVGLRYLIHPIRELKEINRKGHLFVLIGPATFSAAMANAAQFRAQTAALLVGETIWEKPNSYQEPRQINLPNSDWAVRYSTRYYKFVEAGENLIRPDKEVPSLWVDYKAGRDAALDWVLNYKGSAN